MRRTIVCGVGAAVLVLCLLAPRDGASAQARAGLAPADISKPGESPGSLRFASDARDATVALWEKNDFASSHWTLKLAARPAGGAWGAPLSLAHTSREQFGESAVAIAPQGGVIAAIWQAGAGPSGRVIRAIAGTPHEIARRRPVRLSNLAVEARSPQVAFDRRGDAVAVWEENNREIGYVVRAAVMPAGRHTWRAPVIISGEVQGDYESQGGPRLALDSEGAAAVVWQASNLIYAVLGSPLNRGWRQPVRLGKAALPRRGECTGEDCCRFCQPHGFPKVALDAAGDTVVAWGAGTIQAAVRPAASGIWQAPARVSHARGYASSPQVAADVRGDAMIVWAEETTGQTAIMAAAGTAASGGWRTPVRLGRWPYRPPPLRSCAWGACKRASRSRVAPTPQVALGADGEAVAVWASSRLEMSSVNLAVKPAGGSWRASPVLAEGSNPWIAIDGNGQVRAAWVGLRPNPEETLEEACEPVVQTAVLVAGRQAAAKRTRPSSSCSSMS